MTLFLRLSAARWLVPAGAAAALVVLLLDRGWQGGWGDTVLRATTQLLLVLPAVAAAGAIDAHRLLDAARQPTTASAVRPARAVAAATSAVTAWGLLGYSAVLATASAVTLRTNPVAPSPELLWWPAAGAAAVAAHAAVGVLLGGLVPAVVAVALAVLLGLVGNAALAAYQDRRPALFTVADDAYLGGPVVPAGSVQLLQVIFFVLVAVGAVLAATLLVRPSRGTAVPAGVGLVAAVVAGVVLAGADGAKRIERVDALGPRACSGDGLVCLWADRAFLVEAYAESGRRMLEGAPAELGVRGWTETGLVRAADRAALAVVSNEPDGLLVAGGLAEAVATSLALDPDDDADRLGVRWLEARALAEPARGEFARDLAPELATIHALPEDGQWRWFQAIARR